MAMRCGDHDVAYCPNCSQAYRLDDLRLEVRGLTRVFRCPWCRRNLTDAVANHLRFCPSSAGPAAPDQLRVVAVSGRESSGWRWRIVSLEAQLLEESAVLNASLDEALEEGERRARRLLMSRRQMNRDRAR